MPRKAKNAPAKPSNGLLPREQYRNLIQGLMEQGLPHEDAVATLSEGLRQANGKSPRAASAA